jgi:hypothetical protein
MSLEPLERAAWILFKAWLIFAIFDFARQVTSRQVGPRWRKFCGGLAVAGFLSFLSWANFGTHKEGGDLYRDSGETIVDFEPTQSERNNHGFFVFTILAAPILLGVYKATEKPNEIKTQRPN